MSTNAGETAASVNVLIQEYYTITHNLANVSTVGYKRRFNEFVNALANREEQTGSEGGEEITPKGVIDFSQGGVQQTGRPLDFALYGMGFFVIETPEGALYTRNGVFHTNQQGQIVDCQGRLVGGQAGPIVIPSGTALSELNVSEDGNVSIGGASVGKLRLVDFGENQSQLVSVGGSCFQPPAGVLPAPAGETSVKQGYRESSNVNVVEELVKLIAVTRLYESNMKILTTQQKNSDSILSVA